MYHRDFYAIAKNLKTFGNNVQRHVKNPHKPHFFMMGSGNKDCKRRNVERVVEFNNTIALQVMINCYVLDNV